jgi:hypothetical protein
MVDFDNYEKFLESQREIAHEDDMEKRVRKLEQFMNKTQGGILVVGFIIGSVVSYLVKVIVGLFTVHTVNR